MIRGDTPMRLARTRVLLGLGLIAPLGLVAAPALGVVVVGALELPTPVADVDVVGDRAYVVGGGRPETALLRVIDVSDPRHPVELGSIDGVTGASDVTVVGDRAYVVWDAGLRIYDVSDPTAITLLGVSST